MAVNPLLAILSGVGKGMAEERERQSQEQYKKSLIDFQKTQSKLLEQKINLEAMEGNLKERQFGQQQGFMNWLMGGAGGPAPEMQPLPKKAYPGMTMPGQPLPGGASGPGATEVAPPATGAMPPEQANRPGTNLIKRVVGIQTQQPTAMQQTIQQQQPTPTMLSDGSLGIRFTGTTGRSATNNNPLNLEYRPGSYQDKYGARIEPVSQSGQQRFAKFPNMEAGYQAGLDQIRLDQARGHTLASFVTKFAPPRENPTSELITTYAKQLGVSPDTPLANIPAEKVIVPMLARESSTRIVPAQYTQTQPQQSPQATTPSAPQTGPGGRPLLSQRDKINLGLQIAGMGKLGEEKGLIKLEHPDRIDLADPSTGQIMMSYPKQREVIQVPGVGPQGQPTTTFAVKPNPTEVGGGITVPTGPTAAQKGYYEGAGKMTEKSVTGETTTEASPLALGKTAMDTVGEIKGMVFKDGKVNRELLGMSSSLPYNMQWRSDYRDMRAKTEYAIQAMRLMTTGKTANEAEMKQELLKYMPLWGDNEATIRTKLGLLEKGIGAALKIADPQGMRTYKVGGGNQGTTQQPMIRYERNPQTGRLERVQ